MTISRKRHIVKNPAKKGDVIWLDFPPAPGCLMTVFGMDVRIECNKGDELQTLNHIREWIQKTLLPTAEPETPAPTANTTTTEDPENFIG